MKGLHVAACCSLLEGNAQTECGLQLYHVEDGVTGNMATSQTDKEVEICAVFCRELQAFMIHWLSAIPAHWCQDPAVRPPEVAAITGL